MNEQMTPQPAELERQEVRAACDRFFKAYYTDRDWASVLSMVTEDALCIGLAPDEAASGREAFSVFLRKQMEEVPVAVPYEVREFVQNCCGEGCWCCYARIELAVHANGVKVCYNLRLTVTLHREGEDWLFDVVHVSEADEPRPERIPILSLTEGVGGGDMMELQREVGELITRLFPGGVVCCHVAEDYPMMVSNNQFLLLTGYTTFQGYMEAEGGSFLNCIHPDDRETYRAGVRFALDSNKAAESEYRLHRKDGSYIWVHDICHSAVVEDGSPVIISALIDISDQIRTRKKLEEESELDALTGIYNRKGARRMIEASMEGDMSWVLCILDLDHFKRVNDYYGHQKGDEILRYVGRLLKTSFRGEDTVCRLGGDEFLVFLPNCGDMDSAQFRLQGVADQYIEYLKRECPLSHSAMSIGGVYGSTRRSLDWMYDKADKNLYRIKHHMWNHVLMTCAEDQLM